MQIFAPYIDFDEIAFVLDGKRLWKQRVETMQVMNALVDPEGYGYQNHPAVNAWRGSECALMRYQWAIVAEGKRRGYTDNVCLSKTLALHTPTCTRGCTYGASEDWPTPVWWGDHAVHESHRSVLLHKDFDHYIGAGPLFDETPLGLPYQWPVLVDEGYVLQEGKALV